MKPNSTLSELKMFMLSLGFDYYGGKYYQCFKKEEGNCELTVSGAEDLQKLFQRKQLEARIEELSNIEANFGGTIGDIGSCSVVPAEYFSETITKIQSQLLEMEEE